MPLLLQNESLQVPIEPALGASWMGLRARVGDRWLSLMPEPGLDGCGLKASSFIMAPYSNRIAEGSFRFAGVTHTLQNAANHAIHGDVRKRPWTVLLATPTTIRLAFRSGQHDGVNWPWPFDVEVTYTLDGPAFSSRLILTNRGETPMPAGLGFHPYLVRSPTRVGEPVVVQFTTTGTYPDASGTRIPSGPATLDPRADFSRPRELDPGEFHDFCACGYDGGGSVEWPESGVRVAFRASPTLGHLVFYNPADPWFAFEPVSNANDGVNLLERGDDTSGVTVLEPGESLGAALELQVSHTTGHLRERGPDDQL